MDIVEQLSKSITGLKEDPSSIDVSSIISLLSNAHETIAASLSGTTGEVDLSQSGAASNEKIERLEKEVLRFSSLYSHLKNVVAGKIESIYKNSPLKKTLLSSLNEESISIDSFLQLQSQVEHQFNTAWLQPKEPVQLSNIKIIDPKIYKSGGNKWESHA